jgi:transcription elongation factor Elf1
MQASDDQGGRRVACAECGRPFEAPAATYSTVVLPWDDRAGAAQSSAEPPPLPEDEQDRPHRRPPPEVDELEEVDEDNDYRRRRPRDRRRDRYDRYGRFRCPFCGSRDEPRITKKLGGASIALIIVGIFFWPLILIAILLQETWLTCRECGERVRQVDGNYSF